jgi:hypothetical protein
MWSILTFGLVVWQNNLDFRVIERQVASFTLELPLANGKTFFGTINCCGNASGPLTPDSTSFIRKTATPPNSCRG